MRFHNQTNKFAHLMQNDRDRQIGCFKISFHENRCWLLQIQWLQETCVPELQREVYDTADPPRNIGDVSVNNVTALENSWLVGTLARVDPRVRAGGAE